MDKIKALKAISDNTRMNILILLLKHNYCVRALANSLKLSEASISQHLKVLREAGLVIGRKHGYFMHYDVNRLALQELSKEIQDLAEIKKGDCNLVTKDICQTLEKPDCLKKGKCSDEIKSFCHGSNNNR